MILYIDDAKKFSDLQHKFSLCFPSLKMEFFRKKHPWKALSSEKDMVCPDTLIGSQRTYYDPGKIEIKSSHKIGEIENKMFQRFGLNVQIYFKSCERWFQTGASDNLTVAMLIDKANKQDLHLIL